MKSIFKYKDINSLIILLILSFCLFNCKHNKKEKINIQILIERFDKDLFNLNFKDNLQIDSLKIKYPIFYKDFIENILGITQIPGNNIEEYAELKRFVNDYRKFYDSIKNNINDITNLENQFEEGFQNLLLYIPKYKIPKIVAFVGPIDAVYQSWYGLTPDFIDDSIIGISMLAHSGSNFSYYKKNIFEDLYDKYLLRKFSQETIVPNTFKNIVEDIFPDKSASKNLINQIIAKGKRIYFVKKCLPEIQDSILFGYTNKQLDLCKNSENLMWNMLLNNNNLYSKDPQIIRNYIGDAPFTNGLNKEVPGFLGLWIGYKIVESFMQKNNIVKLKTLMELDDEKIFILSSYKPTKNFGN